MTRYPRTIFSFTVFLPKSENGAVSRLSAAAGIGRVYRYSTSTLGVLNLARLEPCAASPIAGRPRFRGCALPERQPIFEH